MKNNKGFTLIELLAVIVILGVLLSLSAVAVNKIRKKQEQENTKNVISSMLTGAKEYIGDHPEALDFKPASDGMLRIKVKDLLNQNYVDFDQNKYSSLIISNGGTERNVAIRKCPDSSTKLTYIFDYYNDANVLTRYNDCGCRKQENELSEKICTGLD